MIIILFNPTCGENPILSIIKVFFCFIIELLSLPLLLFSFAYHECQVIFSNETIN